VTGAPVPERLPGRKRLYRRVEPDMSDEEIDAWAESFVGAVLGDVTDESENRSTSYFRQWTKGVAMTAELTNPSP